MKPYFASLLLALAPAVAKADWTLDSDKSSLAFVSTKAGEVAEVHRFGTLSGSLADDGAFEVSVALDSVDTGIPIRDERMRELLFDTARFPEATVTARVDLGPLRALGPGEQAELATEAQLGLHGATVNLTINATVARLDGDTLLVTSSEPLVVNAGQLGLADGVNRLREIAGLSAISPAVPVTFRLTLHQEGPPPSAVSLEDRGPEPRTDIDQG